MEEHKYKGYIIVKVEEHKWYVKLKTKKLYIPFMHKETCKGCIKNLLKNGETTAIKSYMTSNEEQMQRGE